MRKLVIGGIAAVVLALGFTASNASAEWLTRTSYRWDPACGRYVAVAEWVWVPDVVVPVYPRLSYYGDYYRYRPWYYTGHFHHDHDRHEHHDHHHHH